MDKEQAVRIAKTYAQQVRSIIDPSDIILYGSFVNGTADADSDIDIAIVFEVFNGDYWGTIQRLYEMTISIDTRIEPILLDDSNDSSGFVKMVRREGLKVS